MRRPPGPVGRAKPLADNALASEFAGVPVYGGAVAIIMLVATVVDGAPRSSFASRALRFSIGSRRKSSPSSSSKSEAQWTVVALVR